MAARPTCGQPSVRAALIVSKMFANVEPVVALEADEVVLGGVKDLLLVRIGEHRRERTQVRQPDRIDDVVRGGRGELDQAHALAIGVEAVGFRVDGHDRTGRRARGRAGRGCRRRRREPEAATGMRSFAIQYRCFALPITTGGTRSGLIIGRELRRVWATFLLNHAATCDSVRQSTNPQILRRRLAIPKRQRER